ncbi:helix-turn-helix domain-containing protein [Escherichia sp. E4736]|uniref:helix-turn-helix domain-containing protein n=1 Tax=Escherichia sp. E4736 TaxID=2044466 RepID=UPI0010FD8F66|nr:helix-turn-helix domain-containing protein [Escherichia sp. E4736]TLI90769.1 helix-turn-helix domain-containing protein [Escherichia sp. E4736]
MLKTLTVNAITQYIEDNLEVMSIDINTLIDYSGYSRRYLQILFKNNIGMPVGKYIQLRRITRAAVLLRLTNLNIAHISGKLHYDSQQTFTREFKKNSGYTPLQYRKYKLWSFKNMLGPRKVNMNIPTPTLRHLEKKRFFGKKIYYTEIIPTIDPIAQRKWSTIDSLLSKSNNQIYISHKHESDKVDSKHMFFNAIIWDDSESNTSSETLSEGSYAYFSFTGTKSDYRKFIYNIYMNTLPFYGLQKKDSYDLEIIKKSEFDMYHFEYFLPLQ